MRILLVQECCEPLAALCKKEGAEVLTANYASAVKTFLTEEEPDVIVVYIKDDKTQLVHRDLVLAASPGTKVLQCGWEKGTGPDYFRLPVDHLPL